MSVISELLDQLNVDQLNELQEILVKAAALSPEDYKRKFDELQQRTEDQFQNIANQVATGRMSPLQFKSRLMQILRNAMSTAYRYGLGSVGQSTILFDRDIAAIQSRLTDDARYLSGFYQDLKAKEVPGVHDTKENPTGRFTVSDRAVMYSNALRAVFFQGQTSRIQDPTELINWELGNAEHCGNCIDMADGSPYTIVTLAGRMPGADVCLGLDRCQCSLTYGSVV